MSHTHQAQYVYRCVRTPGDGALRGPCRVVEVCECGAERATRAIVPKPGAEPVMTSDPGPWQGGAQ